MSIFYNYLIWQIVIGCLLLLHESITFFFHHSQTTSNYVSNWRWLEIVFLKKCEPDKATLDRVFLKKKKKKKKSFWGWLEIGIHCFWWSMAMWTLLGSYIGVKEKCFEMVFIIAKIWIYIFFLVVVAD